MGPRWTVSSVRPDKWGRVGWCRCSTIGSWFRSAVPCIKHPRAPPGQKPAMHAPSKPCLHALIEPACADATVPRCPDRACMRRCVCHDALTEQLSCTPAATDAATVTAVGFSLLARWLHICGLCKKRATPLLSCTHSSLLAKLACMH